MTSRDQIAAVLQEIHADYPAALRPATRDQLQRDIFKIGLVAGNAPGAKSLWDVGGGLGAFGVGCARLGMDVTVIDDFRDPVNLELSEAGFAAHRKHGVRVVTQDVYEGIRLDGQADVVSCFASIEHYHSSPRVMLRSMLDHLASGGLFILSAPNCVDIMKRIETLLGRAQWSPMAEWYDAVPFRGHVREPRVADLHYIARDLGLADHRILGRSWIWTGGAIKKAALSAVAAALQPFPSLCTELFMVARKR